MLCLFLSNVTYDKVPFIYAHEKVFRYPLKGDVKMFKPINAIKIIFGMILAIYIAGPVMAQSEKASEKAKGADAPGKAAVTESAASARDEVTKVETKEVTGEVGGISKDFIAVVYKKDDASHASYEVALPIQGTPILQHISNLKQIKVGDTVTVQYDEMIKTDENGKNAVVGRNAKSITFISPAPPQPPEPAAEVADAEEAQ